MLYTRKGDSGVTSTINGRFRKDSEVIQCLGSLDEVCTYLGLIKVEADDPQWSTIKDLVEQIQHKLFSIQARVAGSSMTVFEQEDVDKLEQIIEFYESTIPPISSFSLSGNSRLSVYLDIARTMVRKAERSIYSLEESKDVTDESFLSYEKKYLNRLSSLFYTLVRHVNFLNFAQEIQPKYK